MTKFAIALLFAILTMAPMLIAQAEAQEGRDGASGGLRRLRARLNARAGRLGRDLKSLLGRHGSSTPTLSAPVGEFVPLQRRRPPG